MSVSHDISPLIRPRSKILTRFGREVNWGDFAFRRLTALLAALMIAALLAMIAAMVHGSAESLRTFGLGFVSSEIWNPVRDVYGALPFIYGTIASSVLALCFAVPISLGVAIFLSELAPAWLRDPVGFLVELLAAVPSVVYGLWGIFVLAPWLRDTDDLVGEPRGAARGAQRVARGRARARCHAVGSGASGGVALRTLGLDRRDHSRLGSRSGRDHGDHHGDW